MARHHDDSAHPPCVIDARQEMLTHDADDGSPPLKREPLLQLLARLESVVSGDSPPQAAREGHRPELADGYCATSLFEEFDAAFSHGASRWEVLPPLVVLVRKALDYPRDDTLRLFHEPEWGQLLAMRGPMEAMAVASCQACATRRVRFTFSGFTDEFAAVCDGCGDVLVQSVHDDRALPACPCGGAFRRTDRCPRCGSTDATVEPRSCYEYFATHGWARREGAAHDPLDGVPGA